MDREDPVRGAILLLASSLLFAGMGAVIKALSEELSSPMVVFFRNLLGTIAVLPWLLRRGREAFRTTCFTMHVTRTAVGLSGMYCFFYAIAHLPLAEATLLNYSAPLFIPFIARFWLGEPIPPAAGIATLPGFAGIAMILKPGTIVFSHAALVALVAALFTATAFVSIRRLALHEPASRIVFYFGVLSTIVSAAPLAWTWTPPGRHLWALLLLMGALATSGQILLTRAYALAPAARIGPFSYTTVVFSAVVGWLLWGEVLDRWSVAGTALVIVAGVMTVRAAGGVPPPAGAEEVVAEDVVTDA